MKRFLPAIDDFFFRPASPLPLASLRIGVAALLLLQTLWLAPYLFDLYGSQGILQANLQDFVRAQPIYTLGDIGRGLAHFGLDDKGLITATALLYFISLFALLFGFATRAAAVAVCVLHLLFGSATASAYGVDGFATIALFYLALSPCGAALSLDKLIGRENGAPSSAARLLLRVIQIHLCIAYLASGIEKGSGLQWWTGDAIWRALMLPMYAQYDMSWIAKMPWITRFACLSTLVVECGYAVFMWVKPLRRYWVIATLGLHAGIALFMGLHLFGLMMMVLTFSAFGLSAEPREEAVTAFERNASAVFAAGSAA